MRPQNSSRNQQHDAAPPSRVENLRAHRMAALAPPCPQSLTVKGLSGEREVRIQLEGGVRDRPWDDPFNSISASYRDGTRWRNLFQNVHLNEALATGILQRTLYPNGPSREKLKWIEERLSQAAVAELRERLDSMPRIPREVGGRALSHLLEQGAIPPITGLADARQLKSFLIRLDKLRDLLGFQHSDQFQKVSTRLGGLGMSLHFLAIEQKRALVNNAQDLLSIVTKMISGATAQEAVRSLGYNRDQYRALFRTAGFTCGELEKCVMKRRREPVANALAKLLRQEPVKLTDELRSKWRKHFGDKQLDQCLKVYGLGVRGKSTLSIAKHLELNEKTIQKIIAVIAPELEGERRRRAKKVVQLLPHALFSQTEREVLEMRAVQGKSFCQIGAQLGMSQGRAHQYFEALCGDISALQEVSPEYGRSSMMQEVRERRSEQRIKLRDSLRGIKNGLVRSVIESAALDDAHETRSREKLIERYRIIERAQPEVRSATVRLVAFEHSLSWGRAPDGDDVQSILTNGARLEKMLQETAPSTTARDLLFPLLRSLLNAGDLHQQSKFSARIEAIQKNLRTLVEICEKARLPRSQQAKVILKYCLDKELRYKKVFAAVERKSRSDSVQPSNSPAVIDSVVHALSPPKRQQPKTPQPQADRGRKVSASTSR